MSLANEGAPDAEALEVSVRARTRRALDALSRAQIRAAGLSNRLGSFSLAPDAMKRLAGALDGVAAHANVGARLGEMSRRKGLTRIIASGVGRLVLRLGQLITTEQRIVNNAIAEGLRAIVDVNRSTEAALERVANDVSWLSTDLRREIDSAFSNLERVLADIETARISPLYEVTIARALDATRLPLLSAQSRHELESRAAESVGVITVFHALTPSESSAMITEAFRVLARGGCFIVEALPHLLPVEPFAASLTEAGFRDIALHRGPREYALIAWKHE
jgi:hypothetical protein